MTYTGTPSAFAATRDDAASTAASRSAIVWRAMVEGKELLHRMACVSTTVLCCHVCVQCFLRSRGTGEIVVMIR